MTDHNDHWQGQRALQALIDEVASSAQGAPIASVRALLVRELRAHEFAIPSDSWVDAVAREAVHGHVYAVSHESLDGAVAAPAENRELGDAPAQLPIASTERPNEPYQPPLAERSGGLREQSRGRRGRMRFRIAATALFAIWVLWKATRRRRRRDT